MSEISSEQWLLNSCSITYITTNLNEVNQMIQVKNKFFYVAIKIVLEAFMMKLKVYENQLKLKIIYFSFLIN